MSETNPSSEKTKGDSKQMAENRTALAEDRTLMANERTYSGWTGAGLGCIGIGLGVQAIFKETDPTWLAKLAATIFMAAALAFFFAAWKNACGTLVRLKDHDAVPASRKQLTQISLALAAGTVLVTAILWAI
ncbi:MAG: DUF202 domain-containing protein [Salaquimonas sp.]